MVQEDMTLDELKQITIDYYVNLQRIKKADTGNNPELEYQLKVYVIHEQKCISTTNASNLFSYLHQSTHTHIH